VFTCFTQTEAPGVCPVIYNDCPATSTSIDAGLHRLSELSAVEGLTSAGTQTGAACALVGDPMDMIDAVRGRASGAQVNTDVGAIGTLSRLTYPIRDAGLVGVEIKLAVG